MITVIIPTRNRLAFLREAVASVAGQSFHDWELVVVDDASEDGTWEWLGSLGDARIRVLRMERHRERSAARNAGLAVACGEAVLFLDDDDWLLDGALARLWSALRNHGSAVASVGARVQTGPDGRRRTPHPRRRHFRSVFMDAMAGWAPVSGQTLLQVAAVRQAGGWNETLSLAEDTDFWLRLSRLGPVVLIPQSVLAYRVHPGQTAATGVTWLAVRVRRARLSELDRRNLPRAGRALLAMRYQRVASRAFRRGNYGIACFHWWLAVREAPWLLASPIFRPEIATMAAKSLLGLVLGNRAIGGLRRFKRILRRALPIRRPRRSSSPAGWKIERPGTP